MHSRTSDERSALTIASLSLATTSRGVLAGAATASSPMPDRDVSIVRLGGIRICDAGRELEARVDMP